jgi:hypothetical protein
MPEQCSTPHSPNTVIDEETIIAISHTSAILMLAIRLVEWLRDPSGLRMPKYRPRLMKHMCKMLAEQASTSQVT